MHPEVRRFTHDYETKMLSSGRQAKLGEIEIRFLETVFGPEFGYNFKGLAAQHRVSDYKDGNRFIDFYYNSGHTKIIIEIDGYRYHVDEVTTEQYDDHQERQNDLMLLGGWLLLRFTANMVMKKPMRCRRQLMHAVGKSTVEARQWQTLTREKVNRARAQEIIRLAEEGPLRPIAVSSRFNIDRRTASRWLAQLAEDGELQPMRKSKRIVAYQMPLEKRR